VTGRYGRTRVTFAASVITSKSRLIRSGVLIKPGSFNTFKQCMVPAGPKARLIIAYINDYAYRNKTQQIDLGANLHQAMKQMNVTVCGSNAKELTREVENVAAAEINMGLWTANRAHQETAKVAKSLSFWIEKNPQPANHLAAHHDHFD
jgi:hypothetical protein